MTPPRDDLLVGDRGLCSFAHLALLHLRGTMSKLSSSATRATHRWTVQRLTPNRLAAARIDTPRLTSATIPRRRDSAVFGHGATRSELFSRQATDLRLLALK